MTDDEMKHLQQAFLAFDSICEDGQLEDQFWWMYTHYQTAIVAKNTTAGSQLNSADLYLNQIIELLERFKS